MPKSIFASQTFQGTLIAVGLAIVTPAGVLADKYWKGEEVAPSELIGLGGIVLAALAGGGISLKGRIDATVPIFTPKGFYGPNKEDLEESGLRYIDFYKPEEKSEKELESPN
jgi:hypothetical protein